MKSFRAPALRLATLAIIATVAFAACGRTNTGSLTPASPVIPAAIQPDASTSVTISGYAFHPQTVKIKVGTTVAWTNKMNLDHTVTANGGAFDSGHLAPGHTFKHTFKRAGKFPYHCMIHPFMKGTVTVTK